ncbi:uncharacterized protein J8A68_002951 [[Candida] subhashii]|uniref:Uncharacterized protein n=1 Tax=[Candida] subhashii TaxID=561895 RepID=A0A8J5QWJ9_9ASCO|nr:uncharacterized protein J8A68_002951 [[Candida] subhashii]KAG7663565.1 hypothetical protein J8A68_002951 [[Candida] subhashii]
MQGSYSKNGLPRPYYMKPTKKKRSSPYDNLKQPIVFFTNSKRKLGGYIVMLLLFGTLMWWISQDLKAAPEPTYEIVKNENIKEPNQKIIDTENINLDRMVNNVDNKKADKEIENVDLAGNLAQDSKGKMGLGVVEAPKGGIANEAPVVGSDEDKLIGTGKGNRSPNKNQQPIGSQPEKKGYKAEVAEEAGGVPPPKGAGVPPGGVAGVQQPKIVPQAGGAPAVPPSKDEVRKEAPNKKKVQQIIKDTEEIGS